MTQIRPLYTLAVSTHIRYVNAIGLSLYETHTRTRKLKTELGKMEMEKWTQLGLPFGNINNIIHVLMTFDV